VRITPTTFCAHAWPAYQEFEEAEETFMGLAQLDKVLDGVAHDASAAHHHLDGVAQVLSGEGLHLLGKGGGEENRLPVRASVLQHLGDLGLKPEVEHAVGLVYGQICDTFQVRHFACVGAQHVDHTPGSTDDDLRPLFQLGNLVGHGSAAVDGAA
jgi:hypothetical protein